MNEADALVAHTPKPLGGTLADRVAAATGASPLHCYQCGRCAAGCLQNISGEMDLSPTRIMRLLQLETMFCQEPAQAEGYARQAPGRRHLLALCRLPGLHDPLPPGRGYRGDDGRIASGSAAAWCGLEEQTGAGHPGAASRFRGPGVHRGRVNELALVMRYKLATGHLLQDAALGPAMLRKGKLHLLPKPAPDSSRVRAAARKLQTKEGSGR